MSYPELSYILIKKEKSGVGQCAVIKWGESGYYNMNYFSTYTQSAIDAMNRRLGINKEESRAMEICSMSNIPNKNWECHYNKVLGKLRETSIAI